MKTKLFFFIFLLTNHIMFAQNKKEQDIRSIKDMCGCFEVNFAFAETFSPDKNYKPHEAHQSSGLEWVELVSDENDKIVLQHLLIVTDSTGKNEIVKHWRQDWLYENTKLYLFDRDNTWRFLQANKNDVKGQWTQAVYQVDDSPRYMGTGTWVHYDGKHYWENTTDTPLPRREFTTRKDYNVLKRRNRHEITTFGWVHEQDNDKIMRNEASEILIAQEKGLNTYKKVENSRCELAQKYWKENQNFWAKVRTEWDGILARNKDLIMEKVLDGKPMFMHIFGIKPEESDKIKEILNRFLKQ